MHGYLMLNLKPEAVSFLATLARVREWHIATETPSANQAMAHALQREGLVWVFHHYRRGKKQRAFAVWMLTTKGRALVPELELAAINAEHPAG